MFIITVRSLQPCNNRIHVLSLLLIVILNLFIKKSDTRKSYTAKTVLCTIYQNIQQYCIHWQCERTQLIYDKHLCSKVITWVGYSLGRVSLFYWLLSSAGIVVRKPANAPMLVVVLCIESSCLKFH